MTLKVVVAEWEPKADLVEDKQRQNNSISLISGMNGRWLKPVRREIVHIVSLAVTQHHCRMSTPEHSACVQIYCATALLHNRYEL